MAPQTILIVDDEASIRSAVQGILEDEGYAVQASASGMEGLAALKHNDIDLVLLDIWMPGKDGLATLEDMTAAHADVPVIMISGHGTVETAVRATKAGAYDFIEKPLGTEKMLLTVERALDHRRLALENRALRDSAPAAPDLIGTSASMQALRDTIERVAPTDSWVLITGDNGTGKEVVAHQLHTCSRRTGYPFVDVNCAAIPEELIESELFGHEKGAFTGATMKRRGKFDLAHTGTLFLDEIADMSLKTQAKILRILQEQKFERVGGTSPITVNVRVIAATNKDLPALIETGQFRDDLYYRLNVVPIHVPPLRDRSEDIPLFVAHFLSFFTTKMGQSPKTLSADALDALVAYTWPGNVRELKNVIERLVIMVRGDTITARDLPAPLGTGVADGHARPAQAKSSAGDDMAALFGYPTLREARRAFERDYIVRKLKEHGHHISRTAEAIGLERTSLHRKIKDYNIATDE